MPGVDALLVNLASFQFGTVAHEFGHSLQVGPSWNNWVDHAIRLKCDTTFREDATSCHTGAGKEYQDTYGVMGGLNETPFHFNAVHKDLLGWFDSGEIIEVRESGTFTIQAIEPDFGLRALKMCRAPGNELYVETRRAVLSDSDIEHDGMRDVVNGALLHVRDQINPPPFGGGPRPYASYLIDPSPDLPNDETCGDDWCATDPTPTMKPGDTLYDATGGITLNVLASNHRAVTVEVLFDEPQVEARPVENLQCSLIVGLPLLTWQLGDCYDEIEIQRDGESVASLPSLAKGWVDASVGPGIYNYSLTGKRSGLPDTSVSCEVVVP